MSIKLTNRTVASIKPKTTAYDVRDSEIKGFLLRVRPTGSMTYLLQYRNSNGAQKHFKIGLSSNIKPEQARDIAKKKAGEVAQGVDIQETRKAQKTEGNRAKFDTLRGFFENKYLPWVKEHRRNAKETEKRIWRNFGQFFDRKLVDVNTWVIEKWRSDRIKAGATKETVNRDVAALKAAISKAVDWEIIDQHPLAKVKPLKRDSKAKVRYLSENEEKSLRKALQKRDMTIKSSRDSANQWRKERGYEPLPSLKASNYADHLTPIVLLTINTGLRRGEVFNLKWHDINQQTKTLTVTGATAKSGETRHIPLNDEAITILKNWRKQVTDTDRVFPGKDRKRLDNIKTSWTKLVTDAKVENFRFHDLRHSFASKLVMKGVPLNTVRELLGHSDLKTTLRYAHLAPDHKADAVALLNL